MKFTRFVLTIVLPLLMFLFLAVNVLNNNIQAFDAYVYSMVSKIISGKMTIFMKFITFLASQQFLGIICALVFLSIFTKKQKYSFYAAMTIINISLSSIINVGLKWLINRNRPDILKLVEVTGLSFPSGHSMAAISFYGFIIYLCGRFYKGKYKNLVIFPIVILIALVGLSRIYLGVHYSSDVLGGFSFGVLWLGVFTLIIEKAQEKHV
ncbi:phosphatase PAP2 family protein [Ruminiclostridium cellobioparum]|uniref:phosphatase PAP2 family protein n=1 Tax=Ruminiclostridium cellobioparum TaxID=29355 RepID=UPI000688D593|nr:phosphatase PAP2 family protein [Ruminiclostridium cellobioparum]